ncbi:MAG: HAD family hydrolase [Saprospiraceae bacterium]|jgi:histidinol-phosphate phosphatase family protein|nr:HAD family hydrolase [Saprospiraceae bacterium]
MQPSLFLDRDGVINRRTVGDYVRRPADFEFESGALEALRVLAGLFGRIVVVTNQAGVGKGLMSGADLAAVHRKMLHEVRRAGGRMDRVYHCPHRPDTGCYCRKPATGMALQARADFPDIRFEHAWIVGDSGSDMQFGLTLGMKTALIAGKSEEAQALAGLVVDGRFESLLEFAGYAAKRLVQHL